MRSHDRAFQSVFCRLFKGLVYPQIWEDPEVDMVALAIQPGHRIVTIASGGCNALSYLTADPARVEAVDLNRAHVAFNRLKLAALKHLPDYATFIASMARLMTRPISPPTNALSARILIKKAAPTGKNAN